MRVWLVGLILLLPVGSAAVSPQQIIVAPHGTDFGGYVAAQNDFAVVRAQSDETILSPGNGAAGMWLYSRSGSLWNQKAMFGGCTGGPTAWLWVLGEHRLYEPAACKSGEPPAGSLATVVNLVDPVNTGRVHRWAPGPSPLADVTMPSADDRIQFARSAAAGNGWWATTWHSSDLLRMADTDDTIHESLDQEVYEHVGIYLGDATAPAWTDVAGPDPPTAFAVQGVDQDIFVAGPTGTRHFEVVAGVLVERNDGMTMPPGSGKHGTRTFVSDGVHVLRRTAAGWLEEAVLPIPDGMTPTGASDADGDMLAVGIAAIEHRECETASLLDCWWVVDRPGMALLYHRTQDASWILHETVLGPSAGGSRFATKVALTGQSLLIGAPGYNEHGAVFIRTINQWPTAGFSYAPTLPLSQTPVQFVDTSTDPEGQPLKRQWDFDGDGVWDATGPRATWTFPRPGLQPVTLRVEDTQEGVDLLTRTIDVQNRLPQVDFYFDPSPVWRTRLTTAFATTWDPDGEVVSWQWNFGDGRTSTEKNPVLAYPDVGVYRVRLTATDDYGDSVTVEKDIEVFNHAPVVELALDRKPITLEPFTVTATATDPDGAIVSTRWLGVDGTGATWTHTPMTPAPLRVGFEATDDVGAVTQGFLVIEIENRPPTAALEVGPGRSTQTPILFRSQASDPDGRVAAWSWDFGDGNTTADPHPSHSYAKRGTYEVRLQVMDDYGAWSPVATGSVTIDNRAPTARIDVTKDGSRFWLVDNSWDPDGDALTTTWSVDGEPRTAARNWSMLPAGTHVVQMRVTDQYGAWSNATAIIGEPATLVLPRVDGAGMPGTATTSTTSTSASTTTSPNDEPLQEQSEPTSQRQPSAVMWPWWIGLALLAIAAAAFVVRRLLGED